MTPDPRCIATQLDELMPEWDVRSAHQIEVKAPVVTVAKAVETADFSESKIVRGLLALRRFGQRTKPAPSQSLRESLRRSGFIELVRVDDEEVVIGVAGRFWRPDSGIDMVPFTPETFLADSRPGFAKVAWNFSMRELEPGRTLLCTQTRIRCFGDAARRKFKMYWFVVGPFSGLIRHAMLRMVRRRAESAAKNA